MPIWFDPLPFSIIQIATELERHSNLLYPASLLNSLSQGIPNFYQLKFYIASIRHVACTSISNNKKCYKGFSGLKLFDM